LTPLRIKSLAAFVDAEGLLENDLQDKEYVNLLNDDFLSDLAYKYGVRTQALMLKNLNYIQE
jgi:hypothetical protein